ncbi:MAG TPA: hypothetical protein EYQ63_07260, partial [Fuerstia sp.]|nr:hypothetical protein [Fuerstiella sp.]
MSCFQEPSVLAWVWSVLNLVLSLAVYTRQFIHRDYAGMTRMRTAGGRADSPIQRPADSQR